MHVRKKLELVTHRLGDTAAADDHGPFRRRSKAPEEPHRRSKNECGCGGDEKGEGGSLQADRVIRYEDHQQNRDGCCAQGPNEEVWQLVDREVSQRPLVTVVEAVKLGEQQSNRQEDRDDGERNGIVPRERKDADEQRGGAEVGECEHSSQEGIAPPATISRLAIRSELRAKSFLSNHWRPCFG